jgi:hypothetical protein
LITVQSRAKQVEFSDLPFLLTAYGLGAGVTLVGCGVALLS